MQKTLGEIAALCNGEVIGNEKIKIRGVAGIKEATEGEITFIANLKYISELEKTSASAVIVPEEVEQSNKPLIRTKNSYLAFAKILNLFYSKPFKPKGIDKSAVIGKNSKLGKDISIYPLVYLGDNVEIGNRVIIYPGVFIGNNTKIGEDSLIYPNVTVREMVTIGKRVIIHSGTVVGSDGFGYANQEGKHFKIPQVGTVLIEDDVEIGANVAVDRATMGITCIKRGTKIDNLVQIAHNVIIGEDSVIVGQAGIAGSTKIGNRLTLAGQAVVAGHIEIGDDVVIAGKAGVTKSVASNSVLAGFPAIPHKDWLKSQSSIPSLPKLRKTVHQLEKRVRELEEKLNNMSK